ncbi:hypothetical protein ZWY2020_019958 [Hordeum vulgare]|nr:hypothetical protein ZWY2020_019958 [Hordeum vulgare]
MVSWSDGDSRLGLGFEDFFVDFVLMYSYTIIFFPLHMQLPATTEDSDFVWIETDIDVFCHGHGKAGERHEGKNYDVVEWTDPAWPTTMEDALAKLWDMYKYCKKKRIEDNLINSFDIHTLKEEKIKLQATYERLVEDVNGLLDARE